MRAAETRARVIWPLVSLFAVIVYAYALDGLYIPHIGDEAPYIEIVRLTAESGDWLPLRTPPGLENTKPPALFWLGIVSTSWAEELTLWRLRAPVLSCTLLVAALTFLVARKMSGDLECAFIAALTFVGFYSSYQYGRPFLTNLPETLFVFLAFALVLVGGKHIERTWLWGLAGVSLGVACLFKSFALVAPVGLALSWYTLMAREYRVREFLRIDAPRIAFAIVVALACFAMWPIMDPAPEEILRHFVVEENVGKLAGDGYVRGLFIGPYALHRLWLGHLANAGLFAFPLIYVVVAGIRGRHDIRASAHERGLWILVLSFLIVFSIPSQRQENYLIPTVPALAILIAIRWRAIADGWFRLFNVPAIVVLAVLIPLIVSVRADVLPPGSYAAWQLALPVLVLAGWLAVSVRPSAARYAFHGLVLATFLAVAAALAPFEGPLGRFEPSRVAALARRKVFVPESFIRRQERHRFLLPGARVEGYDPSDVGAANRLLEAGRLVVVHRGLGETDTGPFRVMARRLDLTSRHTPEEMWRIAFRHELSLLVRQELVVRRFRREREQNE